MKAFLSLAMLSMVMVSVRALDDAAVMKKIAELKNSDEKVRAAAIAELTPLYVELSLQMTRLSIDQSPEVAGALLTCQMKAKRAQEEFFEKDPAYVEYLKKSRKYMNETSAVALCRAYLTAQDLYRRTDYNNDGVLEYAQALSGKDSLYENKPGAADIELIDKSFANADATAKKPVPKDGYIFKVLTAQGKDAAGGERSFLSSGRLTLGYALVAFPAEYDAKGRNTFIVSNAGTIYQKDLGPDTVKIAEKMTEFNPDKTWVIAE